MSTRKILLPFAIAIVLVLLAACASGKPPIPAVYEMAQPATGLPAAAMPSPGAAYAMGMKAGSGLPESTPPAWAAGQPGEFNTEEYDRIVDNPFKKSLENPVSTFSVDVDTASYANLRRYLMEMGELPPKDAVRIEEMVNYFGYSYPEPTGGHPVAATYALAAAPWNPGHLLLRVALKAKTVETKNLPASNLVFLLDTSGSMSDDNKLPLLKASLKILVEKLRPEDRVAIVAYAGSAGLVLPPTPGSKKETIVAAFDKLEAGGSTAGGAGIRLAYDVAKANFIRGGNNRVILATDGDFNIGVSSTSELERLIEDKRKENIYLTVLGFGMGNYKDSRMETLADKGNGNYAYIDNLLEGKKVLGKEIWGTLYAVAKDVKVQIEFNPAKVAEYRLIGYENRLLAREDFNDDTKDAGEMGSGHTVTAFYELVPAGSGTGGSGPSVPPADPLAFQQQTLVPSDDLAVFKLRYKKPGDGGEASILVTDRLSEKALLVPESNLDEDFRFASAVVEFGMLLRDSPYKAQASYQALFERARQAKGLDLEGYRAEFVRIVEMAEILDRD
ncbi:MAG: VWA domain-containing protein [Spirochaetota bacterium]